jgi:hypothetical protein
MCECLLETCDQAEVLVRTTYRLGSNPVEPESFTPRAVAQGEVSVTWNEEAH